MPSPRFSITDSSGAIVRSIAPSFECDFDNYLRGFRPSSVRNQLALITADLPQHGCHARDAMRPNLRWALVWRGVRSHFRSIVAPDTPNLPEHQLAAKLATTSEPIPVNLTWGFGIDDVGGGSAASYCGSRRTRRVCIRSLQTVLRGFGYLNGLDDLIRVGCLPSPREMRSSLSRYEFSPGVLGDEWSRVQPSEFHAAILRRKLAGRPAAWKGGPPYGILLGVASYLKNETDCTIRFAGENGAVIALPRPPACAGSRNTTGPWYAVCLLAWCENSQTVECVESYVEPIVADDWPLLVESNGERRFLAGIRQWLVESPFAAQIRVARKPLLPLGIMTRWDVEIGTTAAVVCLEWLGAANTVYLARKRAAQDRDTRKVVFVEGYRCRSPEKLRHLLAAALAEVTEILSVRGMTDGKIDA